MILQVSILGWAHSYGLWQGLPGLADVSIKFPLTDGEKQTLEQGTVLDDGYETKPSQIVLDEDGKSGTITLIEGKYHQIKRMFESVNNKITYLERITFGSLTLDGVPERGDWRYLTENEIKALEEHGKNEI